jgi:dolichol-phosphate mannosyltransferase
MGESVARLLTEASADRAPSLTAHARPSPEISAPELWPELSVIVPAHNEAENLFPLIDEIRAALEGRLADEIVIVDEASSDDTAARLQAAAQPGGQLRWLRHRPNSGQSAAVLTGVRAARAPWIATLDGDGQNDPADIPNLLAVLEEPRRPANLQPVAGRRRERRQAAGDRGPPP